MTYQSQSVGKLAEALAKAQADLGPVTKNKEVTVTRRDGGAGYKFKYATIDAIIEHVRKALTSNGLWFTQTTAPFVAPNEHFQGRFIVLTTTLYHSSGEHISSEILVPDVGTNQELGSSLTYRKRYALASLLGVGSEEDDDAVAADGHTVEKAAVREPPPYQPPTPDTDAVAKRAKVFGEGALAILQAATSREQFERFYTEDNRTRIAQLKKYVPDLHKKIVDEVAKCQELIDKEDRGGHHN